MIVRLRGDLLDSDESRVIIEASGVGYEVFVPESVITQMPSIGSKVDLHVRQIFREDAITLYGFLEADQMKLFDLLRDVKGCGPKVSLALIGELGSNAVVDALYRQDVKILTKATGVGPRLAERIVVELKDKIQKVVAQRSIDLSSNVEKNVLRPDSEELVDALMALGYRRSEAELAANHKDIIGKDLQEQIKTALRGLRR